MPDETTPDLLADIPDDVKQEILQATGSSELTDADINQYFSIAQGSDNTDPPLTVASVDVPPMSADGEADGEVANA